MLVGEKVPVPLVENVTVPVGVTVGARSVSVTVAVQLVEVFSESGLGVHTMLVDVLRRAIWKDFAPVDTEL